MLLTFATGTTSPFESVLNDWDESDAPADDPDPVGVPPPPPPLVPAPDELLESELALLDDEPLELELLELDVEPSPGSTVSGPVYTGGWNFLVVVVFCDVVVSSSSGGCDVFGIAFDPALPGTAPLVCVVRRRSPIAASVSAPARTARRADAR